MKTKIYVIKRESHETTQDLVLRTLKSYNRKGKNYRCYKAYKGNNNCFKSKLKFVKIILLFS